MEVTDPLSIAACLEQGVLAHGRLDALVNNAGVALEGTIEILGSRSSDAVSK